MQNWEGCLDLLWRLDGHIPTTLFQSLLQAQVINLTLSDKASGHQEKRLRRERHICQCPTGLFVIITVPIGLPWDPEFTVLL
jgi:hypothetical protein